MWEENPANGEVNLALARLNARLGNETEAVRFYRNAINGVWSSNAREQRIATRFELARYLLQEHNAQQAAAELIALQADPPQGQEVERRLELGYLLLQIGEYARAQGVFESMLKDYGDNAQAWLGDGRVSFALGDYRAAERELAEAVEHDPSLSEAKQQLDFVREVLNIAPGLRGLSLAERTRRVARVYDAAFSRLTTCASRKGIYAERAGECDGKDRGLGGRITQRAGPTIHRRSQRPATAVRYRPAIEERRDRTGIA